MPPPDTQTSRHVLGNESVRDSAFLVDVQAATPAVTGPDGAPSAKGRDASTRPGCASLCAAE